MSVLLGVPEHARSEWEQLMSSIRVPTPCAANPDGWNSSAAEAEIAARLCLDCPVMTACAAYARAAGEREGTWGGLTAAERRPPQPAPKKRVKNTRKAAKR